MSKERWEHPVLHSVSSVEQLEKAINDNHLAVSEEKARKAALRAWNGRGLYVSTHHIHYTNAYWNAVNRKGGINIHVYTVREFLSLDNDNLKYYHIQNYSDFFSTLLALTERYFSRSDVHDDFNEVLEFWQGRGKYKFNEETADTIPCLIKV